ncbi:hypothetical protein Mal52_13230 [Symmachiella dynata]|uniref:Uncharacterized protein n=1 Tax=Symmachiella dynata TaxID=2527995 RepID=A0A517ZK32_9PLAN|nr:hypothetical protein [Symmachiella dynata]QDU42854.1 hypothetical protein Mal52_13230 [Symmachiella dynata]
MAKQAAKKAPEKTFRLGLVSASVFVNDVETDDGNREFRNVNLQRRYKDNGDWRSTSSFGLQDLPLAIRVLQLAQQHIEAAEVETHPF